MFTKGTNLFPPKNDIIDGNSVSLNLLNDQADINPTIIPPNTDVLSDLIPRFDPTNLYSLAPSPDE